MASFDELLARAQQRAFTRHLAELVRADRHAAVEVALALLPRQSGDDIATACLGIDITDIQDDRDADGRYEQLLETSYYSDSCGFVFSAPSREPILAAALAVVGSNKSAPCFETVHLSKPA